MNRIWMSLVMIMFFAALVTAQDARTTIERLNKQMARDMLNEDIDACIAQYSEDAISLPAYSPAVRGKKQILKKWKMDMASGMKFTDFKLNTTDLREEGNVAIEIGTYNMKMKMGNGQNITDVGKYITIWEKKGMDWKIAAEIWNSDKNPMEMKEVGMQQHMME